MPTFEYTGSNKNGEKVTETVTAEDRFAVYEVARRAGNEVEQVKEVKRFSLKQYFDWDKINYHLNRVKQDELVMLTRNLSSMIDAGLTIVRALSVIERQSSNPKLKGIIQTVEGQIKSGDPLHVALAQFPETFDDLFISMVKAGEESGKLSQSFATLSQQIEQASDLKKKIRGAMIYPAIVVVIMIGIAFLMMLFVMPTVVDIFEGGDMELPATTQALIATSNFLNEYTLVSILGVLLFFSGIVYFFRTRLGRRVFSWSIIRLPVIGTMAKETNAARTSRTLSSLLDSGVDVMRSVEITRDVVQNHYYKQVLAEARKRVEKGSPLSEVFVEREDLYPILVGEMILVGEETGQISQMMQELAKFYENEVSRKTKDLSTIIEPLLMVVIGAGVGFFALALIGPIYSISDGIL